MARKSRLKKIFTAIKNDKILCAYEIVNIVVFAITIALRFIPGCNPLFNSIYLNDETTGIAITTIVTIVTLVSSLEFLIAQIYFGRGSKRYFTRTNKNILAIALFGIIGVVFSFNLDEWAKPLFIIITLSFTIVFAVFFIIDLIEIDTPRFIDKQIRYIISQIEKGEDKNIEEAEIQLNTVLKDALYNSDDYFVEQIIMRVPIIVQRILENKYKNDTSDKQNNAIRNSLEYIFNIFAICTEFGKNESRNHIFKCIIASFVVIIEKLIVYGNDELIELTAKRCRTTIFNSDDYNEMANFFALMMFKKEIRLYSNKNVSIGKSSIIKKIKIVNKVIYEESAVNKNCLGEEFVSHIVVMLEDGLIGDISEDDYKLLFAILMKYLNKDRKESVSCVFYLFYLWKLARNNDFEDIYKETINFEISEYFVRINPNNYSVINMAIRRIIKELNNNEIYDYYTIDLKNLALVARFTKKEQIAEPLEITKDSFNKCNEEYINAYENIARFSSDYATISFFKNINDFGLSLNKNDTAELKGIFTLYSEVICSIGNIESSDRVLNVIVYYNILLDELNKEDLISESLGKDIIEIFLTTISRLISIQSPYVEMVFEDIYRFGGFDCKYNFILDKKQSMYLDLCTKVKNIGIMAAEYLDASTIKIASGFIGWSMYRILYDNIDIYYKINNSASKQLFDTLVNLNYDENIIIFVGTLFVINYSYCLSLLESDSRYKFAVKNIRELDSKRITFLKKSYLLRKNEKKWTGMEEEKYKAGINKFINLLNDQEKTLNNKQ